MIKEKKPRGRPRKYKVGQHPNSLKNIEKHAFEAGKSGNPDGRNVGKKPKPTLDEVLNQVGHEWTSITVKDVTKRVTKYEAFAHNLFRDAIKGKSPAVKELAERIWGKSPDFVNINVRERPKFTEGASPENYIDKILRGEVKIKS